jgi:flagella basal body P-ring formation protein FlgA
MTSDFLRWGARSPLPRITLGAVALLLLLASKGHGMQTDRSDTVPRWEPPEEISAEIRERLAGRWSVDPSEIHLEWGRSRPVRFPAELGEIELLGGGRNGQWIVAFHSTNPKESGTSVPLRTGLTRIEPFARQSLARGDVLEAANMEFRSRLHWGPPQNLPEPAEAGWVAQRRIDAGDHLTIPAVRPPQLVVSGRPVQLVWTSGALKISLKGKAVGSAAMGERVFVRTEEGHRMSGIVTGPGRVLLSNPDTGGEE